jgi:hypothetical protein
VSLTQIALDDAAIGLANFRDRLTAAKVHDVIGFQRFVGLSPTQDRQVNHNGLRGKGSGAVDGGPLELEFTMIGYIVA